VYKVKITSGEVKLNFIFKMDSFEIIAWIEFVVETTFLGTSTVLMPLCFVY
jgi:hypothetical protein